MKIRIRRRNTAVIKVEILRATGLREVSSKHLVSRQGKKTDLTGGLRIKAITVLNSRVVNRNQTKRRSHQANQASNNLGKIKTGRSNKGQGLQSRQATSQNLKANPDSRQNLNRIRVPDQRVDNLAKIVDQDQKVLSLVKTADQGWKAVSRAKTEDQDQKVDNLVKTRDQGLKATINRVKTVGHVLSATDHLGPKEVEAILRQQEVIHLLKVHVLFDLG